MLAFICFGLAAATAQLIVTEARLAPDGNRLAFIIDDGERNEILCYDFRTESIERVTDSQQLISQLAVKGDLHWIDSDNLLFISKHTGIFQQFVINLDDLSMTPNGASLSSEYYLCFNDKLRETFYIQIISGDETAIMRRPLGSSQARRVDAGARALYKSLSVSPDGRYVAVQVEPEMYLSLMSAETGEVLKDKLPNENTIMWAWAPDGNGLLYSQAYFDYMDRPAEYVYTYDIEARKSKEQSYDTVNFMTGALWAPCGEKFIYTKGAACHIVDVASGRTVRFDLEGRPVAWMPDCHNAVFVNGGEIFLLDTELKTQRRIY